MSVCSHRLTHTYFVDIYVYIYMYIYIYVYIYICICITSKETVFCKRDLQIIGLFCRIQSLFCIYTYVYMYMYRIPIASRIVTRWACHIYRYIYVYIYIYVYKMCVCHEIVIDAIRMPPPRMTVCHTI